MMDGFTYITNIQQSLLDMRILQLDGLTDIRQAGMFMFRGYCVPADPTPIESLGTLITNLIMVPNTIIYGVLAYDPLDTISTEDPFISVNHFTFKVYLEPGKPIIEQYVRSSFGQDYTLRGAAPVGGTLCDRRGLPFTLLEEPVYVMDSRVRIEISNPSADNTITPVVMLICAEPVTPLADKGGKYCG